MQHCTAPRIVHRNVLSFCSLSKSIDVCFKLKQNPPFPPPASWKESIRTDNTNKQGLREGEFLKISSNFPPLLWAAFIISVTVFSSLIWKPPVVKTLTGKFTIFNNGPQAQTVADESWGKLYYCRVIDIWKDSIECNNIHNRFHKISNMNLMLQYSVFQIIEY